MTDIDMAAARDPAAKTVDAIRAVYDQDHARRRAAAIRAKYPDMDGRLFDLMVRAANAEDSLFLLRLDLYHLANRHPEVVPTELVRDLLSAHHVDCAVSSDTMGGETDGR